MLDFYMAAETEAMLPWPATGVSPSTQGCTPPTHWRPDTVQQSDGPWLERTLNYYANHPVGAPRLDLSTPAHVVEAFNRALRDAQELRNIQPFRLVIVGRTEPYVLNERVHWHDCSNFEIVGRRPFPGLGPLPRIQSRGPTRPELRRGDKAEIGKDMLSFEDCSRFRIADIILDGNRTAWPWEQFEDDQGNNVIFPLSKNNLTLTGCSHFVIDGGRLPALARQRHRHQHRRPLGQRAVLPIRGDSQLSSARRHRLLGAHLGGEEHLDRGLHHRVPRRRSDLRRRAV